MTINNNQNTSKKFRLDPLQQLILFCAVIVIFIIGCIILLENTGYQREYVSVRVVPKPENVAFVMVPSFAPSYHSEIFKPTLTSSGDLFAVSLAQYPFHSYIAYEGRSTEWYLKWGTNAPIWETYTVPKNHCLELIYWPKDSQTSYILYLYRDPDLGYMYGLD